MSLTARLAAVPAMDLAALESLLALMEQEWLQNRMPPEEGPRLLLPLRVVFSRWVDLDGPGAMKAAAAIKNRSFKRLALISVCTERARRDPATALQGLAGVPDASLMAECAEVIAQMGGRRDPVTTLALIPKISGATQQVLMGVMGAEWMRHDASHALRRLLSEKTVYPPVPAGRALGRWMVENADGWLKWHRSNPEKGGFIPPVQIDFSAFTPGRLQALAAALREATGSDDAARAWLARSGGDAALLALIPGTPSAAFGEWYFKWLETTAAGRPPLNTTAGWLAEEAHARVLTALAQQFANHSPEEALTWARTLPGAASITAAAIAAEEWLQQAPVSGPASLFAADLTTPAGRTAAAVAVSSLVRTDPVKALESLPGLRLDAALMESLRNTALTQISTTAPERLLEWLMANPDVKAPAAAVQSALKSVAATTPERAVAFAKSPSAPSDGPPASALIVSVWLRHDRSGALMFLRALPEGPERDACTEALAAEDIAMADPLFAANVLPESFEESLRVLDSARRQSLLRRLHERMKAMNVPAAPSLNHRSLKPEDRSAILKNT